MNDKVVGIILAGGMSRRFGSPKAFARLESVPFYQYIIRAMKPVTNRIVIVTNHKLIERFQLNDPAINVLADDSPIAGLGPLAGIFTGTAHLDSEWYLISPVDIPFMRESVYQTLLNHIGDDKDAIVPVVNGKIQPLVSLFHQSIKDKIAIQLERKELSLKQLFSHCKVDYIEMNDEIAFRNINYREDLIQLPREMDE